jgi:hypothetical protein
VLSRREFLARTAATTALATLPFDLRQARRPTCVVLDVGEQCGLPESLAGYVACHPERSEGFAVPRADQVASLGRIDLLVIPGVMNLDVMTSELIMGCLQQGGTVLLESAAAFGDFREHRDQLREYFQLFVERPVDLWPARGIPYVEYTWPVSTKVRDFSRVIPLAPQRGTVIASVDDIPVALVRHVGRGTLVFLGSPLGPALWAGDAQARQWLGALLALAATRQT